MMTGNRLMAPGAAWMTGRDEPDDDARAAGWRQHVVGFFRVLLATAAMLLIAPAALADKYDDTVALFKHAGKSAAFFDHSYGYAVFPTVGKGGLVVGAAHGDGRVFRQGVYIGDTSLTQVSVGFQAGGEAFSQIIFFEDARALKDFTSGSFEFGADVTAVAITAGVSGTAATTGTKAGASGGQKNAVTAGSYYKGIAVFTITKGGAMVQASVGGQKFSFRPRNGG
jgi:lipid-binding SYLF domain-containing protein